MSTAATSEEISYSLGTKFVAVDRVWELVSVGNGRYGFRAQEWEKDSEVYTMPCRELHESVANGSAVVFS